MKIKTLTVLAVAAGLAGVALAEETKLPPPAAKTGVTYVTDIKPIFDQSCAKCHSGEKAKGKLKLDSREGALKGSKEGKVITVGQSAESLLVKAAAHATADDEYWMPPLENRAGIKPLTPEQVGLIRTWIDQGAK